MNEIERKKIDKKEDIEIANNISDYKRGFADGIFQQIEIMKKNKAQIKQKILEEIEKKIIFYKRLWMDAVRNKNKHQEDIFYNVYRNLCDIKIIIIKEFGELE